MENPIKMDDLGVPLFLETPIIWDKVLFWDKLLKAFSKEVAIPSIWLMAKPLKNNSSKYFRVYI